jgi:hypothetical protein
MVHSPRVFDQHGKFIPLNDTLLPKLETSDPSKAERYIALRDCAAANAAAEKSANDLNFAEKKKRAELRAAIRARDTPFPRKTFLDNWREARNSRGWW